MTDYDSRRRAYLEWMASLDRMPPAEPGEVANLIPGDAFLLLSRLELERAGAFDGPLLENVLAWIRDRRDCADFALAALLRLTIRYGNGPLVPAVVRDRIRDAALDFCYWYDQRGIGAREGQGVRGMCFHTENHQIVFHACELMAGQLWPDAVFPGTGRTGTFHVEHAVQDAGRWIQQRARFGFSEWLSSYYEEDLLGLVCLRDFAHDHDVRGQASMLVDMLLFEIAQHSHHGAPGSTHGRAYAEFLTGKRPDPNAGLAWLAFGFGEMPDRPNMALTVLAASDYRVPDVVQAVAHDRHGELLIRERHGISPADAEAHGLDPDSLDDAMFFWAGQTARHPRLRQTALRVAELAGDPWLVDFVNAADRRLDACRTLIEEAGGTFDGDAVDTALSEVNLITYRTREALLSSAQDFRPGRPGYQQHIWQATLDGGAVVFTTHPGSQGSGGAHTERPNFWAGNGWLPRAAQHRNILVALHHVPADDPLPFSHAFFPKDRFDEVRQSGNWTFGRKNDGYVALWSQHPAIWHGADELRAENRDNVWLCEIGTAARWGTFSQFIEVIADAAVEADGLSVAYHSPSAGEVRFAWTGPLWIGGTEYPLTNYPRLDSPYGWAELGENVYHITAPDGRTLTWDFR